MIFKKKNLHQNWNGFSSQILVISKKKKVLTKIQSLLTNLGCALEKKNSTFLVQITSRPSQLLLPINIGGAVFIFGAKIGLKSTKNVLFCILFRPMGGLIALPPPAPWLRYWNMHCNNKDTVTSSLGQLGLHFGLKHTARNDQLGYEPKTSSQRRLTTKSQLYRQYSDYKIYHELETVPVVQKHKHFDKERTLPHKFELNHYLIFWCLSHTVLCLNKLKI